MQRASFRSFLAAAEFQAASGGRLIRISSKSYFVVWEIART